MANGNYRDSALRTIRLESEAVAAMSCHIDDHFDAACEILMSCSGRAVVIGMGKSGHVANKVAATLASTGTPAFFVHPGEASHGDIGMITKDGKRTSCASHHGKLKARGTDAYRL